MMCSIIYAKVNKFAYEGTLNETKENWLELDFYNVGSFGNKLITFQQTSSGDDPTGEGFYPVLDVRDANEFNNGVIPLADVPAGTYGQWDPYGDGQLDIGSRLLADLNDDGIVNGEDYALFADGWGESYDNHIANISGPNGIPDFNSVSDKAIVDYWDLGRFCEGYLRDVNEPNTW